MARIEANGLGSEVAAEGKGTPVVLLHGFPDTSTLWRHQVAALTAAGFRTIAPDMRGRGRSDRPAAVADYALPKIVGDVTGIMDALGIRRAHVVGHDWGAAVAWGVAMLAPDRVDHLVAISVGAPGAAGLPTLEALQKSWYRILFQFEGIAEDLAQRNDWYLMREMLQAGGDDFERYKANLSEPGALTARPQLVPRQPAGGEVDPSRPGPAVSDCGRSHDGRLRHRRPLPHRGGDDELGVEGHRTVAIREARGSRPFHSARSTGAAQSARSGLSALTNLYVWLKFRHLLGLGVFLMGP